MRFASLPALLFLSQTLLAADTWPQFGGPSRDFRIPAPAKDAPEIRWKRSFEPGTSGVVSDGKRLYTMAATPKESGKAATEWTLALDPVTGPTLWQEGDEVQLLKKQESFGGAPMQPQSTPVIGDGMLYTVGFTGLLRARDSESGKLIWSADLVNDYKAEPVQFGASSSPILFDGKLIVHSGGESALIAFDPKKGDVVWKSTAAVFSYATPVPFERDGKKELIQQCGNELIAVDSGTGKLLWSHPLLKKGMTNVPTPIVLPGGDLLVSGQGWDGVRRLNIDRTKTPVAIRDVWHQPKVQFFYGNAATDESAVYGFSGNGGKRFAVIDLKAGKIRFQLFKYTDSSLVFLGKDALVLRGDGFLSRGEFDGDGFEPNGRLAAVKGRCWTPPTILGGSAIIRSDRELAAIPLSSLSNDAAVPADATKTAMDEIYSSPEPQKITTELLALSKKSGVEEASKAYGEFRKTRVAEFNETAFRELLNLPAETFNPATTKAVARDWMTSFPKSIPAYEAYRTALVKAKEEVAVTALDRDRLVLVKFAVKVPASPKVEKLFLAGNASALGNWNPEGLKLTRGEDGLWTGEANLPTGELEFKVTQGSGDTFETNSAGGSRGNRTATIQKGSFIEIEVSGWPEPKK